MQRLMRGSARRAAAGFAFIPVLVLLFLASSALAASRGGKSFTINPGVNRTKLDPQPDYEKTMKEGAEKKGASVKCTSGYRTPAQQRAACMRICGRDRCPNKCAPPGGSNHQKVATCDLQGIPGNAQAGCDYLFEMCQQMRSRDRSLQCEIGGYGPGAHHLAVGKGIRPSAYNQCKHLKSKMGMDPGRDQRLQNDADKLEKEIMGNPQQQQPQQAGGMPQIPQIPQASQGSPAGGAPPGSASYPSPIQSGATSPTPGSPREASNSTGSKGSNGKSGSPITIDIKPGFGKDDSDVTKRGLGGADPSGITGGPNSGENIGVAGGVIPQDGGGREFNGASKPVPSSSGGFGSGGGGAGAGGGSASSGGAKGAGGPGGAAGTDGFGSSSGVDLLGSFSGGGGGGGKLSSPKVSVQGSEVDAAVKSLAEEFQADGAGERDPASEEAGGTEDAESGSLFERMHEAHTRCLRRGCVSRAR